jgi:hypothetical protein
MSDNQMSVYVAFMQLAILTIGVVTVILKMGKRDAMIDRSMDELLVLKDIAKDLVKTDIEQGKSIIMVMGELKELRHRIETLEKVRYE